jgi:hypothetical protein
VGENEPSYTAGGYVTYYNHYGKQYGGFFKKLKMDMPYNSATPLLGIYKKECDSDFYKSTCTPLFITALFTISKLWKQPRCLTVNA